MKALVAICILFLAVIGCMSDRSHRDSFASLHELVKRTLTGSADCGPIASNQTGFRYFEVKPQPRGLLVTVNERKFFSQTEWDRRYSSGTNQISQFMEWVKTNPHIDTNHPDPKIVERFTEFTNGLDLLTLPSWHYQDIGVDVAVQELDVVYDGSDKDDAEARKRYREIVKLLEPYNRANNSLQPTATASPALTDK
jgi:hypothetical protein